MENVKDSENREEQHPKSKPDKSPTHWEVNGGVGAGDPNRGKWNNNTEETPNQGFQVRNQQIYLIMAQHQLSFNILGNINILMEIIINTRGSSNKYWLGK